MLRRRVARPRSASGQRPCRRRRGARGCRRGDPRGHGHAAGARGGSQGAPRRRGTRACRAAPCRAVAARADVGDAPRRTGSPRRRLPPAKVPIAPQRTWQHSKRDLARPAVGQVRTAADAQCAHPRAHRAARGAAGQRTAEERRLEALGEQRRIAEVRRAIDETRLAEIDAEQASLAPRQADLTAQKEQLSADLAAAQAPGGAGGGRAQLSSRDRCGGSRPV